MPLWLQRFCMALLDTEFARRDLQGVELRSSPARLAWRFDVLNTSDNHEVRVRFVASAQVPDDATDRRVFAEVILHRPGSVTIEQLGEHFRPALMSVARDLIRERDVAAWLDPAGETQLSEALQMTVRQVGFSCGVQILPPFACEVRSSTFERSQRLQQNIASQQQTLTQARQLLAQFNELREASPALRAGELLNHLPAARQSEMLTALLATAVERPSTESLFAVSGTSLVKVDPRSTTSASVVCQSDEIGPFRSITVTDQCLLIGGQRGVMEIERNDFSRRRVYRADVTSDFGFNSVTTTSTGIIATHVEAGVLLWTDDDQHPAALFRSFTPVAGEIKSNAGGSVVFSNASLGGGGAVKGPRHLMTLNPHAVMFTVGPRLMIIEGATVREIDSTDDVDVIAILPLSDHLLIVRRDGRCQTVDRESTEVSQTTSFRRNLRAAALVPWLDSQRLLIADASGAVDCVGLEDAGIVRFESPLLDFRMLAACPDRVAAVASDRQRIAIWDLSDPRRTISEIHVAAITRHRIAAIAFA